MPMMKIRPVRVHVAQRFVIVRVTVAMRRRQIVVAVVVVPIIVSMHVSVELGSMAVLVDVLTSQHKTQAQDHQAGSGKLREQRGLSDHDPGDDQAEEWCRGEDHLRTGRTQVLSSANVQTNRRSVGQSAKD